MLASASRRFMCHLYSVYCAKSAVCAPTELRLYARARPDTVHGKTGPDTGLKSTRSPALNFSGAASFQALEMHVKPENPGASAPRGAAGSRYSDPQQRTPPNGQGQRAHWPDTVYGALDLGTNNCRLLLARPSRRGFRVVDAFSRIIRLGEGVSQAGRLSDHAMARTMDALRVCAGKLARHRVTRARMVATQACRIAANGPSFIRDVRDAFGLDIEILTPETEAKLAVSGCATLIDQSADYVLVFDIGGGSSEIILLDLTRPGVRRGSGAFRIDVSGAIVAWTSLPVGVVTLAERFGGHDVTPEIFEAMVLAVHDLVAPFEAEHKLARLIAGRPVHLLGTSGTVTTIAGVLLGLPRYDRNQVDGIWLRVSDVEAITQRLVGQTYEQRTAEPCIGRERADLVLAGCAILDAILRLWPAERLRVADRGLREGILTTLMMEDGVWRSGRRRRRGGARRDGGESAV